MKSFLNIFLNENMYVVNQNNNKIKKVYAWWRNFGVFFLILKDTSNFKKNPYFMLQPKINFVASIIVVTFH